MASYKILFKAVPNGDLAQREIIAAIKSVTSNRVVIRGAVPFRDAGGKLIGVNLNLPPAITDNDNAACIAAILAHSSVAVASLFPIGALNNFNTLIVDQPVTTVGTGSSQLTLESPSIEQEWQGASTDESVGEAGSAIRMTDLITAVAQYRHEMSGSILFDGPANGLALITALEISGAMRVSPTVSGGACGEGARRGGSLSLLFGGAEYEMMFWRLQPYAPYASGEWFTIYNPAGYGDEAVNSGVDRQAFVYFKYRFESDGGIKLSTSSDDITYTQTELAVSGRFPSADSVVRLKATRWDEDNAENAYGQMPLIIDNLKIQILDGSLI